MAERFPETPQRLIVDRVLRQVVAAFAWRMSAPRSCHLATPKAAVTGATTSDEGSTQCNPLEAPSPSLSPGLKILMLLGGDSVPPGSDLTGMNGQPTPTAR